LRASSCRRDPSISRPSKPRSRFREGRDPYVKKGRGVEFCGNPDGKARIFALSYEPPAESPDPECPFWPLDATDRISLQTDFKKCAVKVERSGPLVKSARRRRAAA
jgi:hypothetical protein